MNRRWLEKVGSGILLLTLLLMFPFPGFAEVEEEIAELREEVSEIKKDLQEIKRFLQLNSRRPGRRPSSKIAAASIDDDPILGDRDAPITLIEFSDYQCPFCGRFFRQTLPQIEKEFIQTGKVRYVFRDFPVQSLHPEAQKAAEAAECAGEQGKYWEFHDLIFQNQKAMKITDLKRYATALHLEIEGFNECLNSGRKFEEVRLDFEAGEKAGVRGTPSFILGRTTPDGNIRGAFIVGAQPFSVFKATIEELLETLE